MSKKIVVKRPCLVGGYGASVIPRNTVVTPSTTQEADALVKAGLAEEFDAKKHAKAKERDPKAQAEAPKTSGAAEKKA